MKGLLANFSVHEKIVVIIKVSYNGDALTDTTNIERPKANVSLHGRKGIRNPLKPDVWHGLSYKSMAESYPGCTIFPKQRQQTSRCNLKRFQMSVGYRAHDVTGSDICLGAALDGLRE